MKEERVCSFPTCTKRSEANGYCIFHRMYASSSNVVKVQKGIKKESTSIKEIKAQLKIRYPIFLKKKKFKCEIKSPECTKHADTVHHKRGRGKDVVLDENTWMASCVSCNGWVETHHQKAVEMGAKASRYVKATK